MTTCAKPGCDRKPAPTSPAGTRHALCADHERLALRRAFEDRQRAS